MMMRLVPRDWSLNELTNGPSDQKKTPFRSTQSLGPKGRLCPLEGIEPETEDAFVPVPLGSIPGTKKY